ncbi:MAG: hypothetical protein Kow0029_26180 [Candidatus Rifleibacteriota bacterium]
MLVSLLVLYFHIKGGEKTRKLSEYVIYGIVLSAMFMVTISFFPIGGYLSQPLMLEHSDKNADAILVLASGVTLAGDPNLCGFHRVLHGIKLLKEGRAPALYISAGCQPQNGHLEADWIASLTALMQIPAGKLKILESNRITTTATEAAYATEILKKNGCKSILLVTSGPHIYRSVLVYKKFGLEVLPAPSHSREGVKYSMGYYARSFNAAVHEWIGLIVYKIRGYL